VAGFVTLRLCFGTWRRRCGFNLHCEAGNQGSEKEPPYNGPNCSDTDPIRAIALSMS
jgi:hypothetical protein